MNIISIQRKKGNYYNIYCDDDFIGVFHKNTLLDFKIENQKSYETSHIQKFKLEGTLRYAKDRALLFLGYRDYSSKELTQKLQKEFSPEIAEKTVENLSKLGIIDDLKFAKNLAQRLIENKNRGFRRVLHELQLKGIDRETAIQTINSIDFDSVELILKVICKKYMNKLNNFESEQKVIAALLRQGHSYDDIKNAIYTLKQKSDNNF